MVISKNEHGTEVPCTVQDGFGANGSTANSAEKKSRPEKKAKLTWNQIAGSVGAGFAAASTAVSVSFTAVAQPQFEVEEDPNLRMSLETASWFGKHIL